MKLGCLAGIAVVAIGITVGAVSGRRRRRVPVPAHRTLSPAHRTASPSPEPAAHPEPPARPEMPPGTRPPLNAGMPVNPRRSPNANTGAEATAKVVNQKARCPLTGLATQSCTCAQHRSRR